MHKQRQQDVTVGSEEDEAIDEVSPQENEDTNTTEADFTTIKTIPEEDEEVYDQLNELNAIQMLGEDDEEEEEINAEEGQEDGESHSDDEDDQEEEKEGNILALLIHCLVHPEMLVMMGENAKMGEQIKKKGKEYKPPTNEEVQQLTQTQTLFQSNLFRLEVTGNAIIDITQMDELLNEVKVQPTKTTVIETALHRLNEILESVEETEVFTPHPSLYFSSLVAPRQILEMYFCTLMIFLLSICGSKSSRVWISLEVFCSRRSPSPS